MTPERWQQIDQLFHAALAHEPARRAGFIAEACAGDEPLRVELETLISSHQEAQSFIETPAADVAAELLNWDQSRLEAGQLLGNYGILRLLGAGGMGEVYLAEDHRLGRQIALKLLPPQYLLDAGRLVRFEQEARAASALNHPNIVTIHEIGQTDDSHFIATEFIDGQTLRQRLAAGALTLMEVLEIASQVASALGVAHEAGIVHRDIKPDNIMLRRDGLVKVLDFGLAKLNSRNDPQAVADASLSLVNTNAGMVMGTVNYMSPEQARGEEVDHRTDIWSLGVVLYEMVAGAVPFKGETPREVVGSILENEEPALPEASEVPAQLARIITRALRKEREERYATAAELADDLKRLRQALLAIPQSSAEYLLSEMKSHRMVAALVLVFVAVAALTGAYFYKEGSGNAVTGEAIDSVAVLPFVNVTGDPNSEYLSDGISDSVINSLSHLRNLRVISFNSVLRYKGKEIDPQSVGRELNVGAVLVGRLTKRGDGLIISTELVDVRDNSRLWGGQYDRNLSEILNVQSEISEEISSGLRLRLSGEEKKHLTKQYTDNAEAYQLYILGRHYFQKETKEAFEQSINYFEKALKADPNYALAYVALGRTYHWMGTRGFWPPRVSAEKAEWATLKALELDDTLAEAHARLGGQKFNNFDWAGADKDLKRALELDPNSALANSAYFQYLAAIGRTEEALQHAIKAHELDPASEGTAAFAHFLARQYDKAIELYRKRVEEDPNNAHTHILLGEAYVESGMMEEGVAAMEKGVALEATLAKTPERWDRFPMLAYAYAVAGRRADALKILNEQKRLAQERFVSPNNFAIIYTGLGDKDKAFEWLAKSIEQRARLSYRLKVRPMFDSLRSDPRYVELLRRMNLEP